MRLLVCLVVRLGLDGMTLREPGILRHLSHFASGHTSGYLGTVQEKTVGNRSGYEALARDIILHGSPQTVAEKIAHLRDTTGATSIMLHYPPWYGLEKALASLELFATDVAPKLRGSEAPAGPMSHRVRPEPAVGPARW